jgi:hypothetical protein
MAALSNYLENALVDHIMRATAYTAGTTRYVALFTAAPSDSGGGTEVSGGAYARAQLDASTTNWANTQASGSGASSGTGGATSNSSTITFPAPSGANWGSVTHFGIFDASTSGNLLFHGALTTPKTVNDGDPAPTFQAGSLVITFA